MHYFASSFFSLSIYIGIHFIQFSSVTVVFDFATSWTVERQTSLSITNFWSLLKLMSISKLMSKLMRC